LPSGATPESLINAIENLIKDRDSAQCKVDRLQKELRDTRGKLKSAEREEGLIRKLQGAGMLKQSKQDATPSQEILSLKDRLQAQKTTITRLEAQEKRLKNMLIERESIHDQEMIELKRLLNAELKKVKDLTLVVEALKQPQAFMLDMSPLTRAKDREIKVELVSEEASRNARSAYQRVNSTGCIP
jgi:hypothetical protein